MLDLYANQSLTWVHVLARNEYDEIATSTTTTIKGRKEDGFKLVRNAQGEEVTSSAMVITIANIVVGDKLDGRTVIAVPNNAMLDGSNLFNGVYLQ